MGNSICQWQVTVGLLYNKCQRLTTRCKVSINISLNIFLLPIVLNIICKLMKVTISMNKLLLDRYLYVFLLTYLLLILSGDIELNPGPQFLGHSSSVLHVNIRSIRHKLEYIKEHFLDFDILCFTETHLDDTGLASDINYLRLSIYSEKTEIVTVAVFLYT